MKIKTYLWSLLTIMALSFAAAGCSDDDDVTPVPPTPPTPETQDPELTLATTSLDVSAEGGEYSFRFKVMRSTDARTGAVADVEWIGGVTVKESRASIDGEVSFTVAANETAEERKGIITVSYEGAKSATFTLTQAAGDGQQEPDPVLTLESTSLDVAAGSGEYTFNFKVEHATQEQAEAVADAEWIGGVTVKESRASIEGVVSFTVAANELVEPRKGNITVSYKGAQSVTFALTQAGKEEQKPDAENPKVTMKAYAGTADGKIKDSALTLELVCTSADASEAGTCVGERQSFEQFLMLKNLTVEEYMETYWNDSQRVTQFKKDWIEKLNDRGLSLSMNQLNSETDYTVVVDIRTAKGGRTVLTDKVTTGGATAEQIGVNLVKLSDGKFRELVWDYTTPEWKYKGDMPCVIDFAAVWCGPCQGFAPTFKKLAKAYDGKIRFYTIDVDECPRVFMAMAQMGGNNRGAIPFFCFVSQSGELKCETGAIKEDAFRNLLDQYCLNGATRVKVPFAPGQTSEAGLCDVTAPRLQLVK